MIEIKEGRTYRAKKPTCVGLGYVNDRQVFSIKSGRVQYDSPSVANGRHYPYVDLGKFEAWAGRDVTDELPKDEWLKWRDYLKQKRSTRLTGAGGGEA